MKLLRLFALSSAILAGFVLGASAQGVVGLNPTPLAYWQWNQATSAWTPVTNSYSLFPQQNNPQPVAFYGWNAGLGQWTPCTTAGSCPMGTATGLSPAPTQAGTVWMYNGTSQGWGYPLLIEHGGSSSGILQTTLNVVDSPALLNGGALDPGYQAVVAKTDTLGGWAWETESLSNALQAASTAPVSGQFAIAYPASYTASSCSPGTATGDNRSGKVYMNGAGACGNSVVTWSFALDGSNNVITSSGALIPIANVTAVYPFIIDTSTTQTGSGTGNTFTTACTGTGVTLNTSHSDLGFNTNLLFPSQQYTSSTSLTVSAANYNGMQCSITASMVDSGVGAPRIITGTATLVGAYIYYTGSPVSSPSLTYVKAPLQFDSSTSTLSLQVPYDGAPDVGTADNYVVTNSNLSVPVAPLSVWFCAAHANATTTPKLNVNGWGAWTIVSPTGGAVAANDIVACTANGIYAHVVLSGTGTTWVLQNPQVSGVGGVTSVSNSDGSLTVSPTIGAVVASINYAHAGTWTALETFNAGISIASGQGVAQTGGGSTSNCWNTAGSTTTCSGGSGGSNGYTGINNQTGTTYTLVIGDAGGMVRMNNAAANTVTVPPNSSVAFTTGTIVCFTQVGAGQTTLAAGVGVTIDTPSSLSVAAQWGQICVDKVATDTWDASGYLQ